MKAAIYAAIYYDNPASLFCEERGRFPPELAPRSGLGDWRVRQWFMIRTVIGSAPAAVTPGQIPPRTGRQKLRDEIKAGTAKRLAAAKPCEGHPAPGPNAEAADRLTRIDGAGRQMAAVEPDQGRKGEAVAADQKLCGQARKSP